MFGWFKSKEQKDQEELARFQEWLKLKEEVDNKLEIERLQHEEELRQAAKKLEEENLKALKDSDQPWSHCEIRNVDINNKAEIYLDWNLAFIQWLKNDCGFKGDEETIVLKYWAALAKEQWEDGKNDALNILHEAPNFVSAKDAPEENEL